MSNEIWVVGQYDKDGAWIAEFLTDNADDYKSDDRYSVRRYVPAPEPSAEDLLRLQQERG